LIEENLSNDQYGVSELANDTGMSRSNLLRKLKKDTGLSASQFIRQIRLEQAMELLKNDSFNVSEVSYKVGFGSTSYFIKCFRDHYGFPPGEAGKQNNEEPETERDAESTPLHQLAAIMFTDIQGFTALMQKNEDEALLLRNRHRKVFNGVTNKFNGKILQYYGDGTLSTFSSAIDAVKCGIEMQLAFLSDPKIPVRIGIHSGDILFTEDDIIGDGVNVASRIESLASVGSVFISEKVYDEIKNQSAIKAISLGKYRLKNVEKAMEVFAVANPGLVVPAKAGDIRRIKGKAKNGHKIIKPETKGIANKWLLASLAVIILAFLIYATDLFNVKSGYLESPDKSVARKSIAVLPFINDSDDSTNVYIINGLMESILNHLQKIENIRVVSRTSVEKYRNIPKLIPEIAKELNVNYIVEGSGQKIGGELLLNIQLIEAESDKHLWAEQYQRSSKDIFKLQVEVSQNIAAEIEAIITPEEKARIEKIPTENLEAYDYFMKGQDLFFQGGIDNLEKAITYFKKAIEHDEKYAHAYADLAISYYLIDYSQAEKTNSEQINYYADQALLYDPDLAQSLIAKALFYYYNREYDLALPYLEKALEYNPNSALVINTLSDFYANYLPDTEKYLEYALKGINLDIKANDSTSTSYIYLHISNALIQSGFIREAEKYIQKSLDYNPDNIYSVYVKEYILYASHKDLNQLKEGLLATFTRDTTRLDVVQEIAKTCYYMRDYNCSYAYYKAFNDIRETYGLDIFRSEDGKIGLVFSEMGFKKEGELMLAKYKAYADRDNSVYKYLSLAAYYSVTGNVEKAIEHLKLFAKEDNYFYWLVIYTRMDPLFDNIKNHPEYEEVLNDIENKFWNYHEEIKTSLKSQGLL